MADQTIIPVIHEHIASTPGVCGGKPCIRGTRIRVQDIFVWHEIQAKTPEQIAAEFPQLSLADVHAALAYYYDNRGAIAVEMREAEVLLRKMKAELGPGLLNSSFCCFTASNEIK